VDNQLKVSLDKSLCVNNLWCVRSLPSVFRTDDAGQSEAFEPGGAAAADIIEAALGCPVSAISVTNAHTGEDLLA
jgi:ferredoxin